MELDFIGLQSHQLPSISLDLHYHLSNQVNEQSTRTSGVGAQTQP